MPIYVAMLRGINVGGNKQIKMDKLRSSFEALGLEQVKTYIQSGNVVFKTAKISLVALSRKLKIVFLEISAFPLPSFRELLTRSETRSPTIPS